MEDTAKIFHRTAVSLARLLFGMKDPYFMRKIFEKSEKLSRVYINFEKSTGDLTAIHRDNLVSVINEIADLCDYVEHLDLSPVSPLLVLRKNVLVLKLQVLKSTSKEDMVVASDKKKNEIKKPVITASPAIVREKKIDGNREKILNFIQRFPNTRTKEIIDEFETISVRTVKRSLKGLVADGLLQKRDEGNAVFYFLSNVN